MDYMLEPPEDREADYIEEKLEERMNEFEDLLATFDLPEWFSECVNWEEVENNLREEVEKKIEVDKAEAEISAYEARKEAEDYWCCH